MESKKTVLLVDDDVDFVEVNKAALESGGFEVLVAHSAQEGSQLALSQPVDAAILDVIMGTPDEGFHLARALRKDDRTKAIPLVMLTSVNAVNEAKGFLFRLSDRDKDDMWLPVDKFLDKPVKAEVLVATIRELIGG